MISEIMVIFLNTKRIATLLAHFCTGVVRFPTLECQLCFLRSGRLVAVTGPVEGNLADALVEGNT
ncbi:hypothetical protein ABVF61_21630 [Roseibium sp. HPY-6]|uniref:hypothetical protein n=1 Tax=Roseibium sp. HPY-6 TaxID=3229852 RepID=UPI00338F7014